MEKGDRLVSKTATDKYAFPKFIWDIYKSEDSDKVTFIINDLKGKDIAGVKERLKDYSGVLPNHAKFRLVDKKELLRDFKVVTATDELDPYVEFITRIRFTSNALNQLFEINLIYFFICYRHISIQFYSPEFDAIKELILNDPYSLIKTNNELLPEEEKSQQDLLNKLRSMQLDLIPVRFFELKKIRLLKDLVAANYPAAGSDFPNSLYEDLFSGKKYSENSIKDLGDLKRLGLAEKLKKNFRNEIELYENSKTFDDKIRNELEEKNLTLPEGYNEKDMFLQFLKFDMGYWKKIHLNGIENAVPVAKPYNNGISESYNYMLLLPYFKWLAPEVFLEKSNKMVTDENYRRTMVDRMKSFQSGNI